MDTLPEAFEHEDYIDQPYMVDVDVAEDDMDYLNADKAVDRSDKLLVNTILI